VPGIQTMAAPRHTPGHMALRIFSEGKQLFHLVDTVLSPILMEQPDWFSVVDYDREQAADTRRRLLDLAAEEEMLVFGFHFPFPGLGHVQKRDHGWIWQALEVAAAQPLF
jgi:glyoxylase-like metal-dependent hydrolase (beta-lactamase superfamily II)